VEIYHRKEAASILDAVDTFFAAGQPGPATEAESVVAHNAVPAFESCEVPAA
jgi:hypothetical protein